MCIYLDLCTTQHMLHIGAKLAKRQHMLHPWLVLSVQLPAAPSSARVAAWRRLKQAGAAGMTNGTWVLPNTPAHQNLLGEIATTVRGQGGAAFMFAAQSLEPAH
ncbi:Chromate resistance protein ChrB, partial [Devosia psychrophila]|uniref:Chromate resistance protein ChrB n=1 Tax=Devosia psychrophila TaxID=728005 RepID=UPI003D12C1F3